ncbi:MAG: threonine synthase [Alphaproteobacteria bacterium]|nr:threonine synthase [Alphaproteobacteria bacterium]
MTKYVSTRGQSPAVDFATATLNGPAPDGGLYMPQELPHYSTSEWHDMAKLSYQDLTHRLLLPFVGDCITSERLAELIRDAYQGFPAAGAPLVQLGHQQWMLELYRGPTLAFKDYALQLLTRIFRELLSQRGEKLVLLGATSGDTGAAALAAVAHQSGLGIIMLHPHERVSPIQRRQMTTLDASNVRNLAIEGNFDACQDIVKALFADRDLRQHLPMSSVNSINWARIMAQIVYYAASALSLGAPNRPISFCVPSGNFGNVFAGYLAKTLGLPIERLVVASNANDILHRMISHNDTVLQQVVPTLSPSMDIQIASNFERLLYLLNAEDGSRTAADIQGIRDGSMTQLEPVVYARLTQTFSAGMADDAATVAEIRYIAETTGLAIDPHSAIATKIAREKATSDEYPMVALATAHSAKFPNAMQAALGNAIELPASTANIVQREEKFEVLANDTALVKDHLINEFADYAQH